MVKVLIRVSLSDKGRRADVLAGGSGESSKTFEVAPDDPNLAGVVELADFCGTGVMRLNLDAYDRTAFDHVPSVAEALADERAWRTKKATEEADERAKVRAETLAALRDHQTKESNDWVYVEEDGFQGGALYKFPTAHWPYPRDEAVVASEEARVWLTELEAGREVAKEAARVEALTDARKKAAEAAECRRQEEAKAQAKQELRERLGLEEGDLALEFEDGALVQVPKGCWDSHSRAKNWLAQIQPDPSKPGGLERRFAEKAKGSSYYLLPDWSTGDAVEFGADYYSGKGRKSPTRWYGFVVRVIPATEYEKGCVVLHQCNTGKQAYKQGVKFAKDHPPVPDAVDTAIARINAEGGIVAPSSN